MSTTNQSEGPGAATPGPSQPTAPQEQKGTLMLQPPTNTEQARSNHGCKFSRCENDMDAHEVHRSEHFSGLIYVPATADSLKCFKGYDRRLISEFVTALGIGLRYDEVLDPAPKLVVHAHGGVDQADADYEMRIDEATLLYNELGNAIRTACDGTNLSPRRIASIYSGEDR